MTRHNRWSRALRTLADPRLWVLVASVFAFFVVIPALCVRFGAFGVIGANILGFVAWWLLLSCVVLWAMVKG